MLSKPLKVYRASFNQFAFHRYLDLPTPVSPSKGIRNAKEHVSYISHIHISKHILRHITPLKRVNLPGNMHGHSARHKVGNPEHKPNTGSTMNGVKENSVLPIIYQ